MRFKHLIPFLIVIVFLIFIKIFTPPSVIEVFLDYVNLIIYFGIAVVSIMIVELMIKREGEYRINHQKAKIAWSLVAVSAVLFAFIQLLYMTTNVIDQYLVIKNFRILIEFIWLDAFYIFYKSIG